jgi:hypothetical protein
MRIFHIRVNAKIEQIRCDGNLKEISFETDWSAELECDGIEKLEKLLELNNQSKINFSDIPSFIISHIEWDKELDFDTIQDTILKLHTRTISELKQ